jgi:hypothetical protein
MLLRIFRANYFYNYILFPLVGILLLLKSFLSPGIFPPETTATINPVFKPLYELQLPYAAALLLNYIAVMIICYQLLYFNAAFSFVRERTFLPVYLFMFIVYALPGLHYIQPVFIAAIFILLALYNIFLSFEKKKVISNGFNAGFFIGVAGLFYPSLNFLIFLVPSSLYTLKNKIDGRVWIASFLGLLLPALYAFTYYFLTNNLISFFEIYTCLLMPKDTLVIFQIPVIIYLSFLLIVTISASLFILKGYDEKKISTRRYFKILFFFFITSLLLLIIPAVSHELLVIVTIPLTFLLTNYLTFMHRRFWAELFFIILISFSVALQFFVK